MRGSRYSQRTRGGLTNTMKEIKHSQVRAASYRFYFLDFICTRCIMKKVEQCLLSSCSGAEPVRRHDIWGISKVFPLVGATGNANHKSNNYLSCLYCFVSTRRALYAYYLLQNCSATKGNHFSSKGPLPDSIDWRKKGNYVTDVKNQVDFACTYSRLRYLVGITDNSKCRLCYNQMGPKLKNNTLWHVNLFSVRTTILIYFINPISYFTFLHQRQPVVAAGPFPQLAVWSLLLPSTLGSLYHWWLSFTSLSKLLLLCRNKNPMSK